MTGAINGPRPGEGNAAAKSDDLHPITMTPFCKLPYVVLNRSDLTATAKMVLAYLMDRQGANEVAWPSQGLIAEVCGTTRPAVSRAVAELKRLRLIEVRRPRPGEWGRANRYRIVKTENRSSAKTHRAGRLRVV